MILKAYPRSVKGLDFVLKNETLNIHCSATEVMLVCGWLECGRRNDGCKSGS